MRTARIEIRRESEVRKENGGRTGERRTMKMLRRSNERED
jgi:hypothetical protein